MEKSMERKIYLIFEDAACEIKGYIHGTQAEAQACCEKLNKAKRSQPQEFIWKEIPRLLARDIWKMMIDPGFTTVQETAVKWGVNEEFVYHLCRTGRIPGVLRDGNHWLVPVDAQKPVVRTTEFVTPVIMAVKWNVSCVTVTRLCAEGQIPGAERSGVRWYIPADAVNPLEGYILVSELAKKWDMHRACLSKYCKDGRIPGSKCVGDYLYVPADAEMPVEEGFIRKPGYISSAKIAKKWGTSRDVVTRLCREGRIPSAEQINGYWHIPEDAVMPKDGRKRRQ